MARLNRIPGFDINSLAEAAASVSSIIKSLTRDMKKAIDSKDWKAHNRMAFMRDNLKASSVVFNRDINGISANPMFQSVNAGGNITLKMSGAYERIITANTGAIINLTKIFQGAMAKGNLQEAQAVLPQIQGAQGMVSRTIQGVSGTGGRQAVAANIKGLDRVLKTFNTGLGQVMSTFDRSDIVRQRGRGDIVGARLAERRMNAKLAGGLTQTIGGSIGASLMMSPNPKVMLAGVLIYSGSAIANTILQNRHNRQATRNAYAELWHERSVPAMELAALQGRAGGGSEALRAAFKQAADAAAAFGFSAEEGMEAMKYAARQGLDSAAAAGLTRNVFDWERRTGANRGTLLGITAMSERFGGGAHDEVLQAGWRGLKASGMGSGQFDEYLRAMKSVMADGINRGVMKSAEDVSRNMAFLSNISGNNPLWQGEQGARRLNAMNQGLARATSLSTPGDTLLLRAAMKKEENEGKSFIYGLKAMERGFTPELFRNFMTLASQAEGSDNMEALVLKINETFNLRSITDSYKMFRGWRDGKASDDALQALFQEVQSRPDAANSRELAAARDIQTIINKMTQAGIFYWDKTWPYDIRQSLTAIENHLSRLRGSPAPVRRTEALEEAWRNYYKAVESGNDAKITYANHHLTAAELQDRWGGQTAAHRAIGEFRHNTLSDFFRPNRFARITRADRQVIDTIDQTLRGAMLSGDYGLIQAAQDFKNLLTGMTQADRREWNNNNTLNSLTFGCMKELLAEVRLLREDTKENGRVEINCEIGN